MPFRSWLTPALLVLTSSTTWTQPATPDRLANLQVNVDLVLVPVVVTDRSGAAVNGLSASAFTVLEENTVRPVLSVSTEDAPSSIGVIVDLSGSMTGKAGMAARAVRAFFETANLEDEAFLLTVSSTPETVSGFTRDFAGLNTALLSARPRGATALFDTVYLGLRQMRSAHNKRKALLVISDGMDNHSRYSEQELMRLAEEADAQIYTIGVIPVPAARKPIELGPERTGLAFLGRLAERTGGLDFTLASYADPSQVAAKIGRAIRDQYLIGYRAPEGTPHGQWRRIKVTVSLPQVRVANRSGYHAP